MRLALHSLFPAAIMLASAALSINSATAESKINVPFSFVSGGENCPAGDYLVAKTNWGNTVTLKGPNGSFTWIVKPGDSSPAGKQVILRFDQVGQTYLLRSVQYGPDVTSRLDKKAKDIESAQERTPVGGE